MQTSNVTFLNESARYAARLDAADAIAFDEATYPANAEIGRIEKWVQGDSTWSRKVAYRLDGLQRFGTLTVTFDAVATVTSVEFIPTLH